MKLFLIDFSKPWWRIITQQKWLAAAVFLIVFIRDLFWALVPFLIACTLENGSWYYFCITCGIWLFAELDNLLQPFVNTRFQLQCIHSIFYSAHRYLLTIDPQYHLKRSSGVVLAKINRAARGYEELLDQITFEFAPLIIGIGAMIIILGQYSIMLVLAICSCLIAMVCYGYYFAQYICQQRENEFIKSDDNFQKVAFENLAQIQLIRSTFATEYMQKKLEQEIIVNVQTEKKLWMSYAFTSRILSALYSLSVLILLGFFLYCLNQGMVTLPFVIALILAYIRNTHRLIKILQPFRKYMRGYAAIQDLFEFMSHFGKQTIPITTEHAQEIVKNHVITIAAEHVRFKYEKAHIFDDHSLHITVQADQPNKLYGIIGPSGVGKTTLLSILGGQLKPLSGKVMINGIDMYHIGDDSRRQLIALQGQTATSVQGSFRYSLLFGLPQDHGYDDAYLVTIMRRVGLEQLLTEHQGLDTILGEGALNISGGQRQRLNFAGLYLRACYYKPALILIDEPTSSLDELSEAAITAMIRELASYSVTLVIAHRLKTLKDAIGLIDLSLLPLFKEIKPFLSEELKQYSAYYEQLLEGKAEL